MVSDEVISWNLHFNISLCLYSARYWSKESSRPHQTTQEHWGNSQTHWHIGNSFLFGCWNNFTGLINDRCVWQKNKQVKVFLTSQDMNILFCFRNTHLQKTGFSRSVTKLNHLTRILWLDLITQWIMFSRKLVVCLSTQTWLTLQKYRYDHLVSHSKTQFRF